MPSPLPGSLERPDIFRAELGRIARAVRAEGWSRGRWLDMVKGSAGRMRWSSGELEKIEALSVQVADETWGTL